jgi:hypothetical protein
VLLTERRQPAVIPLGRPACRRCPASLRYVGVRPIDSSPVDGPPSSAHDERNCRRRTIQPALRAGRAFARIQKTNLRLRRHSRSFSLDRSTLANVVMRGPGPAHGHQPPVHAPVDGLCDSARLCPCAVWRGDGSRRERHGRCPWTRPASVGSRRRAARRLPARPCRNARGGHADPVRGVCRTPGPGVRRRLVCAHRHQRLSPFGCAGARWCHREPGRVLSRLPAARPWSAGGNTPAGVGGRACRLSDRRRGCHGARGRRVR